jgi:hypothetical protein
VVLASSIGSIGVIDLRSQARNVGFSLLDQMDGRPDDIVSRREIALGNLSRDDRVGVVTRYVGLAHDIILAPRDLSSNPEYGRRGWPELSSSCDCRESGTPGKG